MTCWLLCSHNKACKQMMVVMKEVDHREGWGWRN